MPVQRRLAGDAEQTQMFAFHKCVIINWTECETISHACDKYLVQFFEFHNEWAQVRHRTRRSIF